MTTSSSNFRITNKNISDRIVYLVGSEKNAGKTTYLNYILRQVREKTSPAFLTIGIDGEKRDLVFNNPKPQIYTKPGDYFVTTENMLKDSDIIYEVCNVFPIKTALGRLVIGKTIRNGFIELAGPENNFQLSQILKYLKDEIGVGTIFIDGAANRVTQVAADLEGSFIYVLKVTSKTVTRSIDKLRSLSIIQKIKKYDGKSDEDDSAFIVKGALTERKLSSIPETCSKVIIDDFTKIFLSFRELKKLYSEKEVFFKQTTELITTVVNLYDVNVSDFKNMIDKKIELNVTYNPYMAKNEKTTI